MDEIWKKSEILNQLSGDEAFLRELMGDLKTLIEESLRDLAAAQAQGQIEKIGSISHTLKGSSGNLGAVGIYNTAKALELDCKAGGGQMTSLVDALKKAIDEFLQEAKAQGYLS